MNSKRIKKRRNRLLHGVTPDNVAYWDFIEDLIKDLDIANREVERLNNRIDELGEAGIQNDRLKEQLKEVSEYLVYSLL